jgi:DNA-binding PadR family transcriptional regulator
VISFTYSIIEYGGFVAGKTNLFKASEYALLGLLHSGPTHGYVLHKRITDESGIGMIWGVKISNLYAQLDKLEQKGFIQGILQPGELRPARKEFSITSEGRKAFNTWLVSLISHPRDFRQEFMVRLFFLTNNNPELLEQVIRRQLEECRNWLQATIYRKGLISADSTFEESVYQFRISQIQSMVDWLEWNLKPSAKIIKEKFNHE